jgi:hypothetical protein
MSEFIEVTPNDNFDEKLIEGKHIIDQLFTKEELSALKTSVEKTKYSQVFFPDSTIVSFKEHKNGTQVEWVNRQDYLETNTLKVVGLLFGKHILQPEYDEIDEDTRQELNNIIEGSIKDVYVSHINLKKKHIPEYEVYDKEIDNMRENDMTDFIEYVVISKLSEDKYQSVSYWIMKHKSGVLSRQYDSLYLTKAQYDVIKSKIKI